jgi:hypothetical protein
LWIANRPKIVAIVALLIYSSEHTSPELPDVSEWRACNKPLGLWNSVWAVKVGFDCVIVFWGYQRERASRAANACVFPRHVLSVAPLESIPHVRDVEAGAAPAHPDVDPSGIVRLDAVVPPRGANETPNRQSRTNARNNPNLPHSPLYARFVVLQVPPQTR